MADKDIAPELLERIRADFRALLGDAKPAADTYVAAADYAELVGSALAEAFRRNLTADALPDGRLYWNIADRVVRPLLEEEHLLVADASAAVQQALNQQANLGIAPQRAVLHTDAVDDLLNKVSAAEQFEDVAWVLDEPVRTFSRMVVDDTLKRNVDFQGCGPVSSAPPRATAADGAARWPALTITPVCPKTFTAATNAAAAGWNMTPARAGGRTCGTRRGRRMRNPGRHAGSSQKYRFRIKYVYPKSHRCRASCRNICGRLHRALALSHMIQVMTWHAMQTK